MSLRAIFVSGYGTCLHLAFVIYTLGMIQPSMAQNAMNCRSDYSAFDQVVAANLDKLRKNPSEPEAFASINASFAELMAKEPRRQVIEGPFAPGTEAQKLGMICQGQPDLTYRCTYIYGTKYWRVPNREFSPMDTWLLQFNVAVQRDRTLATLSRVERLGGATSPTLCH